MKKIFLTLSIALVELITYAQSCPDSNHPHVIDLGLPSGTKWACCNIDPDASKQNPMNYGGYYAWGEKSTYEKDNYSHGHFNGGNYEYHDIGMRISGKEYDVARLKWGGTWQMPTKDQCDELLYYCTYTWTSLNGVMGGKFTSNINGRSIFLPAAGYYSHIGLYGKGKYGFYWSGSKTSPYQSSAFHFYFVNSGVYATDYSPRSDGFNIRPVSR